ncbi:MAG: phosphoribosylformylglycinamidine synthase subunit PurS [Phycisphaerales bacterium]|nr:phosphoribosylformylglycinamidine synthase subunit PurS [Phycisphaerales bacterium]
MSNVYRIEIAPRAAGAAAEEVAQLLREGGLPGLKGVRSSHLYFLEGPLDRATVERTVVPLLRDPVVETATVVTTAADLPGLTAGTEAVEVHLRPGVMDPVADSTLAALQSAGVPVERVRTARRFVLTGTWGVDDVRLAAGRTLANDCIEQVVLGSAEIRPAPQPPNYDFRLRTVPLRDLDAAALEKLSRDAHLFLSRAEMEAIQSHFRTLERDPTDLELETLAQTWSEHCVHKTLKSEILYRGAPLPGGPSTTATIEERHYENLLKDTIAAVTQRLMVEGRGPECLSVFKDNAGIIGFDEDFGIAFKVETHNHPSAIEPYGGAATGIGGVIRDVIGCGLGARPIANTDVFCVAPLDWPHEELPRGVLHPWRVLRGIVQGVADYGNRMGIPTVNGAVAFDPRYLGNPLVFAGCVGLIPRWAIEKAALPGDHIVVVGGRTGRDGIHGATFSSAELTDTHADEFSHAVQIGNAIAEKRFLEALLRARDADGGCLYTAITDCGAGGLSSAVGEMAADVGATVELAEVPLKYAGLRYDEIWISEAQERMVVAVPPEKLAAFLATMRAEEVEATVIGRFGSEGASALPGTQAHAPRLVVRYRGALVGALDMAFLHDGVPRLQREATWQPVASAQRSVPPSGEEGVAARLLTELARPNIASKEWIIRKYDHEVQGGSVIKPLLGPGGGPGDAAVLRPRLTSRRGLAVGCGLSPGLADVDPYWMAAAAIDEAVRNVVCVGGDPAQTAILDNFCWGRSDDPHQLGALVRACQACHDVALAYGTPFISGKDSLNNEFALEREDVERFLAALRRRAEGSGPDAARLAAALPMITERVRTRGRLAIPPTLLISALGIVPDVHRCVTPDLKSSDGALWLVGGLPAAGFDFAVAARIHRAVAALVAAGAVRAAHDVSDGGWLVTVAEMAIAGGRGVAVTAESGVLSAGFEELAAGYVVEMEQASTGLPGIACRRLGTTHERPELCVAGQVLSVAELRAAWTTPSAGHGSS